MIAIKMAMMVTMAIMAVMAIKMAIMEVMAIMAGDTCHIDKDLIIR